MTTDRSSRAMPVLLTILASGLLLPVAFAQEREATSPSDRPETALAAVAPDEAATSASPIAEALTNADPEVQVYNDHLTTLASPYMEGRLPGTQGMERAKDYVEYWYVDAGLEPAFPIEDSDDLSYRQPFSLGNSTTVEHESMQATIAGNAVAFTAGSDFKVTGMGGDGSIEAPVVFVGYSIEDGPALPGASPEQQNDADVDADETPDVEPLDEDEANQGPAYSSFDEDDDLTGKIALMLRFEPMDENGESLFSERRRWSRHAGFANKLRAIERRNPAAVIIINTPGASDPRVNSLSAGGGRMLSVPVLMMSTDAAASLVEQADSQGRSLMDLRRMADQGRAIVEFENTTMSIDVDIEETPVFAENVGGLLPGRGALADELIVVGAHLDHLGMGEFGSRSGPGELHPGADDNASGSAGLLLLADKCAKSYAELPDDVDLRSVLFLAFSAEESGLNGSRHYVEHPIRPRDQHVLMINFDMIGRIENDRLSVSGTETGEGMREWLQPLLEDSDLEVVQPNRMSGASDHTSFYRRDIPVLFGIIADFHGDYHTPEDVSVKINRVGAVKTCRLFHRIIVDAAQRPERFPFAGREPRPSQEAPEPGPSLSDITVRFGIVPGSYTDDEPGIAIRDVSEGGSAAQAGVEGGDRLVRWDGKKIESMGEWMMMLAEHKPGDEVNIGVVRDGEELTLTVVLQAKEAPGDG